jgi:hypothetical protein
MDNAHKSVETLVLARAPGFRCCAAGNQSNDQFIAKVHHILNPGADAESLDRIRQLLGPFASQFVAFYERHDGFKLYCDLLSDAVGIELFPVVEWVEATNGMREFYDYLKEYPQDETDHVLTGVAFATVPQSGNYFVMPLEGPTAGKIIYLDHDDWHESPFADDFNGFLERVTREPVQLLVEDLGCYTRYSDDETHLQWIPEEYFPDVSQTKL